MARPVKKAARAPARPTPPPGRDLPRSTALASPMDELNQAIVKMLQVDGRLPVLGLPRADRQAALGERRTRGEVEPLPVQERAPSALRAEERSAGRLEHRAQGRDEGTRVELAEAERDREAQQTRQDLPSSKNVRANKYGHYKGLGRGGNVRL